MYDIVKTKRTFSWHTWDRNLIPWLYRGRPALKLSAMYARLLFTGYQCGGSMRHEIVDFGSITPDRLMAILADRGLLVQGTIESISIVHIHESPTAFVAFLQANYAPNTPSTAPTRFAAKMYKPGVRATWGAKEVAFYTTHAPSVRPLPIVPCYDAFVDPQGTACYCLFAVHYWMKLFRRL